MIKIIKANYTHATRIHELMGEYNMPVWSEKSIANECERESSVVLSAICEGKVIGFIGISTVLDEAELNNIAVDDKYLRRGVATMLFDSAVKELEKRGVTLVMLEVRKSNEKAIRFYEKHGFVKVGERKNYYDAPVEDAILFNAKINVEENY